MVEISFDNINGVGSNYTKKESIELKKRLSIKRNMAHNLSKNTICILCGKKCNSFCNSHCVPQFIIEQIADNGHVVTGMNFFDNDIFDQKTGKKKAIVFMEICQECDQKIFSDYENPKTLFDEYNQKKLNEIALKNFLRFHNKRKVDYEYLMQFYDDIPLVFKQAMDNKLLLAKLDINFYNNKIKKLKKFDSKFYVIDEFVLDYKCNVAFQSMVSLATGFDGEIINNLYNYDESYKTQELHICIFPYIDKTKIILFIEDGNVRYRKFYKKFRALELKDKLLVLNEIIFKYSEEFLLSPFLRKVIIDSDYTMEVLHTNIDTWIATDDEEYLAQPHKNRERDLLLASIEKFRLIIDDDLVNVFEK